MSERIVRPSTVTKTYAIYPSHNDSSDESDYRILKAYPVKQSKPNRPLQSHEKTYLWLKHASRSDERTSIRPVEPRILSVKKIPVRPQRHVRSAIQQTDDIIEPAPTSNQLQFSQVKDEEKLAPDRNPRCLKCLRIFILILNSLLLLISILLLIFSLNLLLNPSMTKLHYIAIVLPQATPSSSFSNTSATDTLLVTAIVGLIFGCLFLIVSVLVYVTVIFRRRLRYLAAIFLLFTFLMLVGLIIFLAIVGDTELQRLSYSTSLIVLSSYYKVSLVQQGWDFVQYYFSCCGIQNNTDWLVPPTGGWISTSQLPRSCCGHDSHDAGYIGRIFVASSVPTLTGYCYYGDIEQATCYSSIKQNLILAVLVFLSIVALLILALFILTIIWFVQSRKRQAKQDNPAISENNNNFRSTRELRTTGTETMS